MPFVVAYSIYMGLSVSQRRLKSVEKVCLDSIPHCIQNRKDKNGLLSESLQIMSYQGNIPAPEPQNLTGSLSHTVQSPRGSLTPSEEKDGLNEDKLLGSGGYSTSSTDSDRLPLASQAIQPSGSAFGDWLVVSLGLRKISRRPDLDSVSADSCDLDKQNTLTSFPFV
jgi:hypothetical protein